jgi:hypothetical protein
MGGDGNDECTVGSVHRFNPVAKSWSAVAPMSVARSEFGAFVLGGSIYAVGSLDGEQMMTSMERYCVASDTWSDVSGGKLCQSRYALCANVKRLEVDLFDSLIAKAKQARH